MLAFYGEVAYNEDMDSGKYDRAIQVLEAEATKIGGEVFVRWWAEHNDETKRTAEAFEFMNSMFTGGKLNDKEATAVKEMNAIMEAMVLLREAQTVEKKS